MLNDNFSLGQCIICYYLCIDQLAGLVFVGPTHKSAIFLGLWAGMCVDGTENNWNQQLQYSRFGGTMLHD